jgi:hypothetical protein
MLFDLLRWHVPAVSVPRSTELTLSPPPQVSLDRYAHISWRQWLLLPVPDLVARDVPAPDVKMLRRTHTGHDNNMRVPAARTIGWWGGIGTVNEIAKATFQDAATVGSYKKKDERRVGGKCALKTLVGGQRLTQAKLAFLVGHVHADRDPHDVCVGLGILRIEYELYRRMWLQIMLRFGARDGSTDQLLLQAANELVAQWRLRVALPWEWWDPPLGASRPTNALVVDSNSKPDKDDGHEAQSDPEDGQGDEPAHAEAKSCEFCGKKPAKRYGGFEEYRCMKCYQEHFVR